MTDDPRLAYSRAVRERPWNIVLPLVFALVSGRYALEGILDFRSVGSHASIYTDAARAWLAGGDPWRVGPPAAVFAGPPPMLLPFVPFIGLPLDVTRFVWVVGSLLLAIWTLRRLQLPGYWIGFPPIFQSIQLGHPEVLVLFLVVLGGLPSGLAILIKPYAGLPLLAERRWRAIALGLLVLIVSAPILPWTLFVQEFAQISGTAAGQTHGDSTFGQPVLMVVAAVALASLGMRRALWLAVPLLWPSAQPNYKVITLPQLSPVLALLWAVPVPGLTLVAIVVEAVLLRLATRVAVPGWLRAGLGLTRIAGRTHVDEPGSPRLAESS